MKKKKSKLSGQKTEKCDFCGRPGEMMTSPWGVPATYTLCGWHFWRLLIWQPPGAPLQAIFRLLIIGFIIFVIFVFIISLPKILSGLLDPVSNEWSIVIIILFVYLLIRFFWERKTKTEVSTKFNIFFVISLFAIMMILIKLGIL